MGESWREWGGIEGRIKKGKRDGGGGGGDRWSNGGRGKGQKEE